MSRHRGSTRSDEVQAGDVLAGRLRMVATVAGVASVVYCVFGERWWWLAAALLAVWATRASTATKVLALTVALSLGAWPATAAVVLSMVLELVLAAASYDRQPLLDVHMLAASVSELPAAERALVDRARKDSEKPVSTLTLLRAAVSDDASRWDMTIGDVGPANGFEGGLLGSTGWTVVACEAVLAAGCRPDRDRAMDIHHLAGIGLVLPNSAAADALVLQRRLRRVVRG